MKVVVQVVANSSVEVKAINYQESIEFGYNLLVGFCPGDNEKIIDAIVTKIINLRILMDDNDKMNLSIIDKEGSILAIPQFTLYADSKKGNRPSFINALNPDEATILFDYFCEKLRQTVKVLKTGVFGADMLVEINNIGPTTIILDSEQLIKI